VSATTAAPAAAASASGDAAGRTDRILGAVMMLVGLGLVLGLGVRHSIHQPVYGPIDEIFHAGYVQKVADTLRPPVYGRDRIFLRHPGLGGATDVHLPDPERGSAPLPIGRFGDLGQNEAIQPPLYYYLVAPVAWITSGSSKIVAIRIASTLLAAAAVVLLYLAVLESFPARPLAAGVAAVALGSMTGIDDVMSEVQNDAVLLPLSVLMFWLLIRDLRRRRVGYGLAVVAGLTCVTQLVAVSLATLIMAFAVGYMARARGLSTRTAIRSTWRQLAVGAAPLSLWVLANLYKYHWPVPRLPPGVGAPPNRAPELLLQSLALLYAAALNAASGAYTVFYPALFIDQRPVGLLVLTLTIGIAAALLGDRIGEIRIPLGGWIALAVVAFICTYASSLLNAAQAGGDTAGIFVARYFAAFLAAAAASVGIATTAPFHSWVAMRRLAAVAVVAPLVYDALTATRVL
jgi:hypothetical protein